jgi:hypothetical protein
MGKTSKPLQLLVLDEDLYNSQAIQDLISKGHTVTYLAVPPHDAVIGWKGWRILRDMDKLTTYVTLMVDGIRRIKYPKESA